MTAQLSRERLEALANIQSLECMALPASHAESAEMARMLLAGMDSDKKLRDFAASQTTLGADVERALAGSLHDFYLGCDTAPPAQQPELTVWYGSMPETNGKTNWTAILHRKGECISTGITIDRSEYPDRVRYEADSMRYLIGELPDEPDILTYDDKKHSGYVEQSAPVAVPSGYRLQPISEYDAMCAAMLKAGPVTAATVPEGWKLVPVEPTEAMLDAAYSHPASTEDRMRKQYASMLAAAPDA